MKTIEISLSFDWSIFIHRTYTLYKHRTDPNQFVILDSDFDQVIAFRVDEGSFEILSCRYDAKHRIELPGKVVYLKHYPDEE
ncbi:hypothetical protein [Peribacillus sp. R9-11]|uniref:hypothetical protein n=1 Tax=Peribacillus sp. R9-11 TaxID=3073271 RepID=UPI002868E1F0|nr:hypothetical protein [Peribacillus sp. R9-11]WMX57431.1 hypothetical protein RE409_09520 [Peribacillus sp. R9-11]